MRPVLIFLLVVTVAPCIPAHISFNASSLWAVERAADDASMQCDWPIANSPSVSLQKSLSITPVRFFVSKLAASSTHLPHALALRLYERRALSRTLGWRRVYNVAVRIRINVN